MGAVFLWRKLLVINGVRVYSCGMTKTCSRGHKYRGTGSCPICWPTGAVKAYIARAPKEARPKLNEMRKMIRAVAPKAKESISYGMPGYDKGRIAWFASMKG